MDLSDEYLKLPDYTIGSLEESSERVFVDGVIPAKEFTELNQDKIFTETLTSEKAVYVALELRAQLLHDVAKPLKDLIVDTQQKVIM